MQTAGSKVHFFSFSETIGALQNILAHSQMIMPDLETPYPNSNMAFEPNDQSINTIITERQQQFDAVSHEISGLEAVMDSIKHLRQQLVERKDKITQSMKLHKRLVSALWRLPTEVLSEIFVYCLPETSHLSPASKLAPMLLTRICRRWREVAVSMPSLWCGLSMKVDDRDWQRAAFCYDSWLERSRGRPLSLALRCERGHWTELRSLLQPYLNQVSSLFLYFSFDASQPEVRMTDFLALEELSMSMESSSVMPAVTHCISQPPSSLRSLNLDGPAFNIAYLSDINPTWARLTNLQIDIYEASALPHLLFLCPDLSSLTIGTIFSYETPVLEPFTHTKLQFLHIDCDTSDTNAIHALGLFNTVSLPHLRTLKASYIHQWPHEEFKAFLTRSKCSLESLIFGAGVTTTDEQRAEYVALIPSLKLV
ncbi:hypothetical protein DEU56DRAFT_850437 [Suillus clintonianus]|uniref:uncharacterized protein n=1 Tax=Suillus clintonianus TaxID=1904413 RepID=UPI001B87D3E5|nr:uncharacterized protein DEU56DRAFT_850437 [Suillus clintonianus]KAG2151513.1 hypothetical protein DEU56DRAFT_850437 [Suillus clintonianus]